MDAILNTRSIRHCTRELPPPPSGVAMLTRKQAAELFGVSLGTWGVWEREGHVPLARSFERSRRARPTVLYGVEDLLALREQFRRLEQPYPDAARPGCYRVPVCGQGRHMEAIIDAEDLPKVVGKRWNWRDPRKDHEGHVILASNGNRQVPLKRIIMGLEGAGTEYRITHANGDGLDCRKQNIVVKMIDEQCQGSRKMQLRAGRELTSRFKGVSWDEKRGRWLAQIRKEEVYRHLGRFDDEVEAAEVYDAAARELFGEHAHQNFPKGATVPARTGLDPRSNPVRKKQKYRVTPPLPRPPEGMAVMTRDEAAVYLRVSDGTFGVWEREGRIAIPRYRRVSVTGTPILYAAADLQRLRDELDKVGQPYADPDQDGCWRVPLRTLAGYIEAVIDAEDLPIVQGKLWNYTQRKGWGKERGAVVQVGERTTARMILKRIILGVENDGVGVSVVHVNGDPLDCRRANLAVRTQAQKVRRNYKITHRAGEPTTSRYKGVCWVERAGKWQSQIRVNDVPRKLGMFDDEIEAAKMYDEAAREVWGAEARVNFPEPGELPTAVHELKRAA